MKIAPTTGHPALMMLRRSSAREAAPGPQGPSPRDLRTSTGRILLGSVSQNRGTEAAPSAADDSVFSVNRVTGEKLLMHRMEQLGKALGVERSRYQDFADFAVAIKDTVTRLTTTPEGKMMLDAIAARLKIDPQTLSLLKAQDSPEMLMRVLEKHLGLDRLGIPIDSLVTAAQDLQGGEAGSIIGILLRDRGPSSGRPSIPVTKDEAGLYRVGGAARG